jgi:type I restriction enzyme S subunit
MLDETKTKWPLKPLSEVVDLNPRLDKSGYRDDLEVSFVPMAAVEAGSGRMDVSEPKHFGSVKKGYTPFKEGDVLFAKITPCMENGKMAVVPKLINGLGFGSTEFHVLRPHTGMDPRYVYYFVSSQNFRREAAHQMTGAVGQKRVPQSFLEAASIPVPLFQDQQRIVAEIEKQFSRLDEAVASLKRTKDNLRRYKAAVLKAAVEGELTEEWRRQHPDVEPASKLLERILVDARSKDSHQGCEPLDVSCLRELPKGSRWVRVEDVGAVQLGRQRAPKYHSGKSMRPYLRVQNVFEARIDVSDVMEMDFPQDDYTKFKLEPGDILLNEGQSPELLGRPAIYRGELPGACFTNTLIQFRPHTPLTPEYPLIVFRAYMRTGRFTREGTITTNIAHLSAGRFAKIEFPLPPLKEQQEIVAEVERRLSVIDELEATVEANLTRADRLRQSILSQAFSGRLLRQGSKDIPGTVATFSIAAESQASYGKDNRAGR